MIIVKIKDVLERQGKTVYWLSKNTNISQNSLGKIVKGETSAIRYDNLNSICKALNCRIEELIEYIPDK